MNNKGAKCASMFALLVPFIVLLLTYGKLLLYQQAMVTFQAKYYIGIPNVIYYTIIGVLVGGIILSGIISRQKMVLRFISCVWILVCEIPMIVAFMGWNMISCSFLQDFFYGGTAQILSGSYVVLFILTLSPKYLSKG